MKGDDLKRREEEVKRKYPSEDFFGVDVSPEMEKAVEEDENTIEVEASVKPQENLQIEPPKEEVFPEISKKEETTEELKQEEEKKEPEAPKQEEQEVEENSTEEQEQEASPENHQADIVMRTSVEDSKSGESSEKEEVLASCDFPEVPAKVFFKKGLTRNLGNFESYRVDVGIEMPCSSDKETVKKYVLEGGKVVEHRLAMEIQKAQRLYGNAGGSVFDRVNVNL